MLTQKITFLMLISVLLMGCGGGGGGGSNIVPETVTTPSFTIPPFIPSEPYETHQLAVNAPTAWEQGFAGQGTIISVIDSGINISHTDFTERSGVTLIDTVNATGFQFNPDNQTVYQVNDYNDNDGHGTYVSSIASGQQYGIAPSSSILPIKVFFDQPSIDSRVIDSALPYAAKRSDVINASMSGLINPISIGTTNSYDIYRSALQTNNTVLITAAGNDNQTIGADHFENNSTSQNLSIDPQLNNKVLNVISVDENGLRSSFSNTPGSCADVSSQADIPCDEAVMTQIQNNFISAPGEKITAASYLSTTGTVLATGTSMAAPIVSGSISLLLSAWDQLTPMDAVSILKTTANRSFAEYSLAEYGVGLLDIAAALEPIGTLSAATTGQAALLSINDSTATLPVSLAAIKNITALQQTAYFDDYNRDFSINTTANIYIRKNSIDWNTHWRDASFNARYTQTLPLGEHQLSITHDPSAQQVFQALSLSGDLYALHYTSHQAFQKPATSLEKMAFDSAYFIGGSPLYKANNTINLNYQLSPSLSLSSDFQWAKSYARNTRTSQIDSATQFSLIYQASPNFQFGFGVEHHQENNALFDLQGEGTLSFGEQNQTQLNVLSANYRYKNNQFYGLLKIGQLASTQKASASYIHLQSATIGQSLLGVRHQLDTHSHLGLQAYRTLGITSANMTLTIPVGMDSNGTVQTVTETLQYQESLLPNTLELYYRSQPIKNLNYTLNLLAGSQDIGLGLTLNRPF